MSALLAMAAAAAAGPPEMLRVESGRLVDLAGEPVALRGVNLGNWFLIEPWMLGAGSYRDQASLRADLAGRFGAAEAERLIGVFRDHWITQRDLDRIAGLGFNAVRIPFDHAMLEDAPFSVDESGFARIEGAVRMAESAGLYVVLDMHAAPGGQSTDGPSGDVTANGLWGDDENIERLAWLWQRLAREYRFRPALAAYEILNEPYGDFATDHRADLVRIADRAVDAIRLIDPERAIFVPGTLNGIAFYGDPSARGWSGVGLGRNVYPGLFDARERSLGSYARFWAEITGSLGSLQERWDVPILIGEMQPLWDEAGSPDTTRIFLDRASENGWASFVWSWKLYKPEPGIGPNNWYLATNASASSLATLLRTGSAAQIESAFRALATDPIVVDASLELALGRPAEELLTLPVSDAAVLEAADGEALTGFTATDIGGAPRGAVAAGAGGVSVFGGGRGADNLSRSDSLRLVHRSSGQGEVLAATVAEVRTLAPEGLAGLMVRSGTAANAAFAWVAVGADGLVRVVHRATSGSPSGSSLGQVHTSAAYGAVAAPVSLAIRRQGSQVTAWYAGPDGDWRQAGPTLTIGVGFTPVAGLAVCSGDEVVLSRARFEGLGASAALPAAAVRSAVAGNLLANGSFESGGGTAAGWSHAGAQMTRESGWSPRRTGEAILAYRHWESGSGWQSVSQRVDGLAVGAEHEFEVYVNHDRASAGATGTAEVQLRVLTVGGREVVLESRTVNAGLIEENGWSVLGLAFRPTGPSVRVEIRCRAGDGGSRDGAVKFDDASVVVSGP